MRTVEITARTVEDAIKEAMSELNLNNDEIDIEVIEESSRGFLGLIGGKNARIRATEKANPLKKTVKLLNDITNKIGVKTEFEIEEKDEYTKISMVGGDLGILIGRRGETLDALQYIVNLVANKNLDDRKRIILDAEGYRKRREDTLIRLAKRLADKVKRTGHRVLLEPMNPQERRIIHTALQNDNSVQTLSDGEEPYRRVVISLKRRH